MPQLILPRRRQRGDRGTIAALVAVLMAGNVLLAMGALAIDVGVLYVEREELQSGADAAAIAVAKMCAASNDRCGPSRAQNLAVRYAGDNAKDGESAAVVCGRVLTGGSSPVNRLSPCGPDAADLTGCLRSAPAEPAEYIEVRSTTRTNGEPALPPVFAGAVTGTDGTTVRACSRVMWGPVRKASSDAAIAMSICDFRDATTRGQQFQPAPDSGVNDPDVERSAEVELRWRPPTAGGCTWHGDTIPGGFNWIPEPGSGAGCGRTLTADRWYDTQLLPGSPTGCARSVRNLYDSLRPVTVAVFDGVRQVGSAYQLRVVGLAVFVITGWRVPTSGWPGGPTDNHRAQLHEAHLCPAETSTMCLYGYFTTRVLPVRSSTPVGPLGTDHFGAIYIRTVG